MPWWRAAMTREPSSEVPAGRTSLVRTDRFVSDLSATMAPSGQFIPPTQAVTSGRPGTAASCFDRNVAHQSIASAEFGFYQKLCRFAKLCHLAAQSVYDHLDRAIGGGAVAAIECLCQVGTTLQFPGMVGKLRQQSA